MLKIVGGRGSPDPVAGGEGVAAPAKNLTTALGLRSCLPMKNPGRDLYWVPPETDMSASGI